MRSFYHLFVYVTLILSAHFSLAQSNDWINYSLDYYKIKLVDEGIYRISYSDLESAGFSPSGKDPRLIKLYRRGQEVAIRQITASTNNFAAGDYFEFYAPKQDSDLETGLYTPEGLPFRNKYLSMYNDTSVYFLVFDNTATLGQRISNTNATGTNSSEAIFGEKVEVFKDGYSQGRMDRTYIYDSRIDIGEGWGTKSIQVGQPISKSVSLPSLSFNGLVSAELLLLGDNANDHIVTTSIQSSSLSFSSPTFTGRTSAFHTFDFQASALTSSNLSLSFSINSDDGSNFASVAYAYFKYPIAGSSYEGVIETEATSNDVPYSSSGKLIYEISDPYNQKFNSSSIKLTGGSRFYSASSTKTPISISRVSFSSFSFSELDYIILSNKTFSSACEEYKAYRSSSLGGEHDVAIFYINEIYDAYGYGEENPNAIKEVLEWCYQNYGTKHLFIVGNGNISQSNGTNNGETQYDRFIPFNSTNSEGEEIIQNKDYVPSYGAYPGSDILYTEGFSGEELVPDIAVGRLPITTEQELRDYLNKVQEHESLGLDQLWRKNILHLSGGQSSTEAAIFKSLMSGYQTIAESGYYGTSTKSLFKTESGIEEINISEEINDGVALVTFLGHSVPEVTEIDIGKVSDDINGYQNKGKYPLLFINGCSSGDTYKLLYTLLDDWVLTPDRGAIAAFGHSSFGYVHEFNNYTERFYEALFTDSTFFQKTIGEMQQDLLRGFTENQMNQLTRYTHAQQFTLFGDPAIIIFPASAPDLLINQSSITLEDPLTGLPSAESTTLDLSFEIQNTGNSIGDSFDICVTRIVSEQVIEYGPFTYPIVQYREEVKLEIDNIGDVAGNNVFIISLDCNNEISELDESDNVYTFNYYLPSTGIRIVYPSEFSVLPSNTVSLISQHQDPLNEVSKTFLFELDTSNTFSSPLLSTESISSSTFAKWDVQLPTSVDSTVFFWRVKLEDNDDSTWLYSSFMHIDNVSGWGQAHLDQFLENEVGGLNLNHSSSNFEDLNITIRIESSGSDVPDFQENNQVFINGEPIVVETSSNRSYDCISNGLLIFGVDRASMRVYDNNGSDYTGCGLLPHVVEDHSVTNETNQQNFIDYFNGFKPGDYVIVSSTGNASYDSWGTAITQLFSNYGATEVDSLSANDSYLFVAQVGNNTPIIEIRTPAPMANLDTTFTLNSSGVIGTISNDFVGVGENFEKLYFGINTDVNDAVNFTITTEAGEEDIFSTTSSGEYGIPFDSQNSLKLSFETTDSITKTPSHLDYWIVTYDLVPEGLALFTEAFLEDYDNNTFDQGDSVLIEAMFINVTDIPFKDSITLEYQIINANSSVEQTTLYLSALEGNDTLFLELKLPTINLTGTNRIEFGFNLNDQAEVSTINNSLNWTFTVIQDKVNPNLDIVFDGIHILDGDIVSPEPEITISLFDNNQYLFKDDLEGVEIYLKSDCDECEFELVDLNNPGIINWNAGDKENPFTITYTPETLSDGTYTLRIKVPDALGNESSDDGMDITFQVINESSISNFYPYPNPFSTSMKFVFTLTGANLPEDLKIQIMTVTGRVVREISMEELGAIHIGHNTSEFSWDGTDEFGDKLANGVYLYRVMLKGGDDFEHFDTASDKAFKRGFGKLYILR